MAITELPEDKVVRALSERLAEVGRLRGFANDLDPEFLRWKERVLSVLGAGEQQGIVRPGLARDLQHKDFTEPRVKMFDEPERSPQDREYYVRGLDDITRKLEAEAERIRDFGGPPQSAPSRLPLSPSRSRRTQTSAPVTHVHVGGDNRGVINTGSARDIQVQWDSPETAARLDHLIARVKSLDLSVIEQTEVLSLLGALKRAKYEDERRGIAERLDSVAKLVPAPRWAWDVAKPHLGF